jgi:hypothetical protein
MRIKPLIRSLGRPRVSAKKSGSAKTARTVFPKKINEIHIIVAPFNKDVAFRKNLKQ